MEIHLSPFKIRELGTKEEFQIRHNPANLLTEGTKQYSKSKLTYNLWTKTLLIEYFLISTVPKKEKPNFLLKNLK